MSDAEEIDQDQIERMSVGYGLNNIGSGIAWAGFWIGLAILLGHLK